MSQKLPKRENLVIEETWDLNLLFKNQADFQEAVKQLRADITAFHNDYKDQLNKADTVIASLKDLESIQRKLSPIVAYAYLGYEVDKFNEQYEENVIRLSQMGDWINEQLSFYHSQFSQLPDNLLEQIKAHEDGKEFQYFIDEVKYLKPTMLSPEVEQVLSSLGSSLNNQDDLYGALKFQDLTFDDFQAHSENYVNSFSGFEGDYEGHTDIEVRRNAWKSFHNGLGRYQNTAASNYINKVQTEKKMATLRGFDSVIDYLLFHQKVSRQGYNTIIDTLTEHFAPVMQRYARLMADEHGIDDLSLADIKMPFVKGESAKISIPESRKMIEDALGVLGEEYLAIVKRAFDERWIDYPMNETKSTGGFCSTVYQGPAYILLNWTGLLSEVLVLAHELGHAGHFNLAYKNQLAISPEPSLYFIEAPSTANEVIMCQYLLRQDIDDAAKRSLIAEFISRTYFHNMVTHLLEADFQRKVYEAVDREDILNARVLNDFFKETLENFWQDALVISEGAELTWMRQPHYFMGLYPYTYSAGLTVGTQIGQRIAKGDQEAIEAWLQVLRTGGTKGPLELAAMAGVNMEDNQAILNAVDYVSGLLDQIEELK